MNEQILRQLLPSLGLGPEALPGLINLLQSPQGQPLMQALMSGMSRQQPPQMEMNPFIRPGTVSAPDPLAFAQQMRGMSASQYLRNTLPSTLFGGLLGNGQGAAD
jgi:hypothetical protein